MAYDRYDTRDGSRDERSRWSERDERSRRPEDRDHGSRQASGPEGRGFFERAGDEVASWFGDEDADRRRRHDQMREGGDRHRRPHEERGMFGGERSHDRDYEAPRRAPWGSDRDEGRRYDRDDYRPITGDYGRSERATGDRSQTEWGRDPYRSTSRAGTSDPSDRSRHEDPHYRSWRDRHIGELDRDYDDYRRENQSRFEDDFSSWRQRRQAKRGLLGQVREHMEVVGSDDQHVGTVDKIAGDRVILTKSDPESGGAHHSLSCSNVDRVEGDRVILDCSADQAREKWRDESRSRALFEREDQGEMGPGVLDRSFSGTYR